MRLAVFEMKFERLFILARKDLNCFHDFGGLRF